MQPKCFGDKRNNKVKFYIELGMSYDTTKLMLGKICRGCTYLDKCSEKIVNGNGFTSIKKRGKRKQREFDDVKIVGEIKWIATSVKIKKEY